MTWQKIETAPKDKIILITNGKTMVISKWDDGVFIPAFPDHKNQGQGWWVQMCNNENDGYERSERPSYHHSIEEEYEDPTHWMPLPLPPRSEDEPV